MNAPREPVDTRLVVTALNTLVGSIPVRAIVYETGPASFRYEVRVDGHVVPDSSVGGFATAWEALQASKATLLRWIGHVLERA